MPEVPTTLLLCLVAVGGAAAQGASKLYPPGWNGEATTPPMGWRSWNAFGPRITNETFVEAILALTSPVWSVDGRNVSLADVGYNRVGIDEGWENCSGADPNNGQRQHDEAGLPMVNTDKFPDLKWLVDYGHSRGIKMGWYLNGCACGERKERALNYQGDILKLHEYGFDAAKFDGCGAATNMTYYAELMAATGRSYEIENCHWGHCGEDSWYKNPDGSSCPTHEWCPFNHFRTSGDINSGETSWLRNLQTTIKFQDPLAPTSVPSCWAYPDMMEVGRIAGGTIAWSRAHFGAWCVVSAPLILGLDVTDTATLASIADFITNPEAIAVNQHWAGHPGRVVANLTASNGPQARRAKGRPAPARPRAQPHAPSLSLTSRRPRGRSRATAQRGRGAASGRARVRCATTWRAAAAQEPRAGVGQAAARGQARGVRRQPSAQRHRLRRRRALRHARHRRGRRQRGRARPLGTRRLGRRDGRRAQGERAAARLGIPPTRAPRDAGRARRGGRGLSWARVRIGFFQLRRRLGTLDAARRAARAVEGPECSCTRA